MCIRDRDIIPSDLATYGKDAKALLKELQSQNERMFLLTFLVMNTGETVSYTHLKGEDACVDFGAARKEARKNPKLGILRHGIHL